MFYNNQIKLKIISRNKNLSLVRSLNLKFKVNPKAMINYTHDIYPLSM